MCGAQRDEHPPPPPIWLNASLGTSLVFRFLRTITPCTAIPGGSLSPGGGIIPGIPGGGARNIGGPGPRRIECVTVESKNKPS